MVDIKKQYSRVGISLLLIVFLVNVALGETAVKNNSPKKKDFKLGVYLNAHSHPENLQISRVMADLASHGFSRIIILCYPYMQYAPQGLHTLAKEWGIELYLGNIHDIKASPEANAKSMRALIKLVNSYPDSDAVKGWYAADEIEAFHNPKKDPGVVKRLRDFVTFLHKEDPNRKVIINHDARNQSWGGFMDLGEDESWCSVFFANRFAKKHLKRVQKEMAEVSDAPLVTVYGAQSSNKFAKQVELKNMGLEGKLADLKKISTRDDIADYILTSYSLGMDGTSFFVYDGYYDYGWWTLVDQRGRSRECKMEGILDAVSKIRHEQGYPSIELTVKADKGLDIKVKSKANKRPIKKTIVEISFDGGYTWTKIEGFGKTGGEVNYNKFYDWQRPTWAMVRARCFDGVNYSLWSVWNVFPWREPTLD